MADKDVESILGLIVPLADQFFTVRPENPRAMNNNILVQADNSLLLPVPEALTHLAAHVQGPQGAGHAVRALGLDGPGYAVRHTAAGPPGSRCCAGTRYLL